MGDAPTLRLMTRFALTFRLPIIVWQAIFFLGPLIFMIAMSFFLVKNYRMTEAFEFVNWQKMLGRLLAAAAPRAAGAQLQT